MKKADSASVTVQTDSGGVTLQVPRLFIADGVIHAVVLTVGIVLVGAVMQSKMNVPALIPPSVSVHPALLMWGVLLIGYSLFFLLCLMGVGSQVLWRLGELGQRGSYVALMLYAVQIRATPECVLVRQSWFIRTSTRRFDTAQIASVQASECGLTVGLASGEQETVWFSLYPSTVKKLAKELQQAVATLKATRA